MYLKDVPGDLHFPLISWPSACCRTTECEISFSHLLHLPPENPGKCRLGRGVRILDSPGQDLQLPEKEAALGAETSLEPEGASSPHCIPLFFPGAAD